MAVLLVIAEEKTSHSYSVLKEITDSLTACLPDCKCLKRTANECPCAGHMERIKTGQRDRAGRGPTASLRLEAPVESQHEKPVHSE